MRFTWDLAKARRNQQSHGVSFTTAAEIFDDPNHVVGENYFMEEAGEQRWLAIGRVEGHWMLAVAHVTREEGSSEIIRIISARRADRKESRLYEEANGEV